MNDFCEEDIESYQRDIESLLIQQDYYAILNVAPTATDDEVRNAYRKWSLIFHPDRQSASQDVEKSARKFQIIQTAYDVLSDKKLRQEYNLQRDSRSKNWTVGAKGKDVEEIFDDIIGLNRDDVYTALENISPIQGRIQVDVDATKMWKKRAVIQDLAFPLKQKSQGFAEMMHWPEISQIKVENSWDIISSNAVTRLDSMTLARNSFGTANLTGTVTRQIIPFWLGTISATLGQTPELSASIEYSPKTNRSVSLTLNSDSIHYPPTLSLVLKQGLASNMMGYFVFRSGSFSIFDWGKGYEGIHDSSCTLGFNRKLSKRAYDAKVTAGSAASQINFSIVQPVTKGVKGTLQVSLSTAYGFKSSVLATKRLAKGTKLSFGIELAQAMGVTLQFRLRHLGRYASIPILISDEIRAGIITSALMIPLIGSYLIDNFYLIPKRQASIKKRLAELREANASILNQRQTEATEATEFMRVSVTKKIDHELSKNGLVIVEALYGILPPSNIKQKTSRLEQKLSANDTLYSTLLPNENSAKFINVTIAIQNQVSNSQLFISGGFSKSNMIGFYDPCLGEKKRLRVQYRFQEKLHWVEIGDRETLALPLREHQISK